jgi:hypothetical protein
MNALLGSIPATNRRCPILSVVCEGWDRQIPSIHDHQKTTGEMVRLMRLNGLSRYGKRLPTRGSRVFFMLIMRFKGPPSCAVAV